MGWCSRTHGARARADPCTDALSHSDDGPSGGVKGLAEGGSNQNTVRGVPYLRVSEVRITHMCVAEQRTLSPGGAGAPGEAHKTSHTAYCTVRQTGVKYMLSGPAHLGPDDFQ